MTLMKYSALLLAGAGVTTALSLGFNLSNPLSHTGLSSSCQSAILGVSSNPAVSSCLNVPGLAAVFTLPKNLSVIPALNTWLEGVCQADPCSNNTINDIAANITSSCQSDISKTGLAPNVLQTIVQDIPQFYPTIRRIACLKTASNNTLCASSTLLDIQAFVGEALSPENALGVISQLMGQGPSFPASLTCTGCMQAAFDTFQADDGMLAANPTVQSVISQQCGASFLSAPQPSDVVEGTGSAAPTNSLDQKPSTNAAHSNALVPGATLGVIATTILSVVAGSCILA